MDGSTADLRGRKGLLIWGKKEPRGIRRGIGRTLQQQGWGLSLSSPFLGLMPSSLSSCCEWRFLLQASRDPDPAPSLVKLRLACSVKLCSSPDPVHSKRRFVCCWSPAERCRSLCESKQQQTARQHGPQPSALPRVHHTALSSYQS